MPRVTRFREETEVCELILPDHLPFFFQRVTAPVFSKKRMGEKKGKKGDIDEQIK